jgi:hypothetical protein
MAKILSILLLAILLAACSANHQAVKSTTCCYTNSCSLNLLETGRMANKAALRLFYANLAALRQEVYFPVKGLADCRKQVKEQVIALSDVNADRIAQKKYVSDREFKNQAKLHKIDYTAIEKAQRSYVSCSGKACRTQVNCAGECR